MDHHTLIEQYIAGPGQLRTAIRGMTPEQIDAAPVPGKWSTRQVICHIADFEPVYVDRMKRVIAQEEPSFFGGDPDLFAARLSYDARKIDEELDLIESCRKHMTTILRTLADADFQRAGIHSEAGRITLHKLLSNVTGHIPHHIKFIEEKRKVMGGIV